ncbi:CPN2 [Symbiodinium pilosum]|uniref:CPN2 protein n=1 Tax=Symbiodinium pilosum TaxID=2952 RepID=A0A812W0I8_SYMPI|nr:CPN2 [Symbiodinium pilosum]
MWWTVRSQTMIMPLQSRRAQARAKLNDLDLSDNLLRSLPENLFAGQTGLQKLDLASNELRALPAKLFSNLTALDHLNLSCNSWGSLPEDLLSGLTEQVHVFNNQASACDEPSRHVSARRYLVMDATCKNSLSPACCMLDDYWT